MALARRLVAGGARALGGAALGAGKAVALGAGGAAAMGLRQVASAVPGGAAAVTAGMGGLGMIGAGAMKGFRGGGGAGGGKDGGGAAISGSFDKLVDGQSDMLTVLKEIKLDTGSITAAMEEMKNLAYEDARSKLKEIKKPSKIIPKIGRASCRERV